MVILGIAFPIAETITDRVPKGFYQIFYVYLFVGSLAFLLFVYLDELCRQKSAKFAQKRFPTFHWIEIVWPDVGIKSNPFFSKIAQKATAILTIKNHLSNLPKFGV